MPLCARCTGILAGAVGASIIRWLLDIPITTMPILLIGLIMIAPTGIDGVIEYWFGVESNNPRRLITGLIAGVGCALTEMAIVCLL